MKLTTLAPLLLLGTFCLMVLAEIKDASDLAWLNAGSETADVCVMADRFAVLMLFRHPLGIPIPLMAIVPANKVRIADRLADFVHMHFLQRDELLTKLMQFNVTRHLASWSQHAMQAQRFAQHPTAHLA